MKYLLKYLVPFFFFAFSANSQTIGKGKVLTRTFDYKNFKDLIIQDFDGTVEIEIGKPFFIEVKIDGNLEPRLRVEQDSGKEQLKIYLKGNDFGKLYLEDTHITIKISLPECTSINHRGNTQVKVRGIVGHHFSLKQSGNGNVNMFGRTDQLDINKKGNGSVYTRKLITKSANVKSEGNGDVIVFAQISLKANGNGNGDIVQAGPGKIETMSGVVGRGKVKKTPNK